MMKSPKKIGKILKKVAQSVDKFKQGAYNSVSSQGIGVLKGDNSWKLKAKEKRIY